jgi:hypothetical protein
LGDVQVIKVGFYLNVVGKSGDEWIFINVIGLSSVKVTSGREEGTAAFDVGVEEECLYLVL